MTDDIKPAGVRAPELKETCGHGFALCWSEECTKPDNWDLRMRRRHQWVEEAYDAVVKERKIHKESRKNLESWNDQLVDENNALKAERDEWARKYRCIEIANPALTKSDHVHFGDLMIKQKELREENERLHINTLVMADKNRELIVACDQLQARLDVAVEALASYADKKNWKYWSNYDVGAHCEAWDFTPDHYKKDGGGSIAREALERIKGK